MQPYLFAATDEEGVMLFVLAAADAEAELTWRQVALAGINALVTVVTVVVPVVLGYFALRKQIMDNAAKTNAKVEANTVKTETIGAEARAAAEKAEAAATKADAAQETGRRIETKADEIHGVVNTRFETLTEELRASRQQVADLLKRPD